MARRRSDVAMHHAPGSAEGSSRERTAERGFTLVEVLVAVAVVAITLAAGLKAAGALTDNAQRLSEVVSAQWCADNALTNLRLTRQFPGVGDSDFECSQLGRDYKGRLVTRPTPNPNFRRVDAVMLSDAGVPIPRWITVQGREFCARGSVNARAASRWSTCWSRC
jgi:general secretion pathway protein I